MKAAQTTFLDTISGQRTGLSATLLRTVLAAGEPLYAAAIHSRNWLFDRGWKRVHRVDAPVISVGNLTTGGTGKTPVVAALVDELLRRGMAPGIASRGYHSLDDSGNDEKRVLDLLCPGIPHVQNRDRTEAARQLLQIGAQAVVLDDAFQHRRLGRDLDIVLVDATNPWGYGHLLPRGLLREPVASLRRAGLVLLTRADLVTAAEREKLLDVIARQTAAPCIVTRFLPAGLRDRHGQQAPAAEWSGRPVAAFCGIGNPAAFQSTLSQLGLVLPAHSVTAFPDHHHYTADDSARLIAEAEAMHAQALVCTLKDLVKLPSLPTALPVLAVNIHLEIIDGREHWNQAIDRIALKNPAS